MTKLQLALAASALGLFFILYFGCETQSPKLKALEKSRVLVAESTDIKVLLQSAKTEISAEQSNSIAGIERQIDEVTSDSARPELLKQLSAKWYEMAYPSIAGFYAQSVAEITGTEDSWSIAGTTYTICVQRSKEEKIRAFCAGRAVQAFENAISLNPENTTHKVNLALAYTEYPPGDNPMKGISILLELNRENPDQVLVLTTLARLALKTSQFDRATKRLERAIRLDPENTDANCLLAQAYEGIGATEKAQLFSQKCRTMLN